MAESEKLRGTHDPLSEATRSARSTLLGVSLVALGTTWVGLIPTKVSFLGIDLETREQLTFLSLVLAAQLTCTVTFWVYSRPDWLRWMLDKNLAMEEKRWQGLDELDRLATQAMALFKEDRKQEASEFATVFRSFGESLRNERNKLQVAAAKHRGARSILDFHAPVVLGAIGMLSLLGKMYALWRPN